MTENVACHSETTYAERPVSFEWQGGILSIVKVLQRWRTPQENCFRVCANDNQIYELYYDLVADSWQVIQL